MALNKIAIFLRRDWKINRFREVIISTFDSPDVSEMVLCSGFFKRIIISGLVTASVT